MLKGELKTKYTPTDVKFEEYWKHATETLKNDKSKAKRKNTTNPDG